MVITFKNKKLKKYYEDGQQAIIKFGPTMGKKYIHRINELKAAKSLLDIKKLPQTQLHKLSNNRKDQYSLVLTQPYRLIIKPQNIKNIDELENIEEVEIVEVVDYH